MLIKVKWGKEAYEVDVDLSSPVSLLKAQLESLTNVPSDKMKIMGVKGGTLKDDANLADVGLTEGKTLMLIGTAEAIAAPPAAPIVFAEDQVGIELAAATTNGLHNLGNTCYMNAAVQTLRMVPELRPVLAASRNPLAKELGKLYHTLDKTRDAVPPVHLWTTLMALFPTFAESDHGRPMQHDSQEALSAFIQVAQQDVANNQELKEKFGSLFSGKLQQTITASDSRVDTKQELAPFTILPCNIVGDAQTLEAGLEQAMDEVFSAPSAELGGDSVTYTRKARLAELPEYLVVHFVRFHWRTDTKAKAKVLKPITFPLVLDTFTLCSDELKSKMAPEREKVRLRRDREMDKRKRLRQKSGQEEAPELPDDVFNAPTVYRNESGYYELCGVISHKGRDADGGHYVAWVLKNGTWLVCDDNNVGAVSEEDVRRLRGVGEAHIAYVLLYRSRDPLTFAGPLLV